MTTQELKALLWERTPQEDREDYKSFIKDDTQLLYNPRNNNVVIITTTEYSITPYGEHTFLQHDVDFNGYVSNIEDMKALFRMLRI